MPERKISTASDEQEQMFYEQFPSNFKWGSTSSATQVEGAWSIDGRDMSWWDSSLVGNSHLIADHSNPEENSYQKFIEDVRLLKSMHATCYKFSLSWSRILPDGTTHRVNKAGVEYYDNLINTLLENDIEPIIVLYHWDFPQELFEKHPLNWMDESVVKAFGRYSEFCFTKFGDRVKRWIPVHDAFKHSECGTSGVHPPNVKGRKKGTPLKVFKNLLKAHNLACRIYNKEFRGAQQGQIGISINSKCIPSSDKRDYLKNELAFPDYSSCVELRPNLHPDATSSDDYGAICWREFQHASFDFVDLTTEDIHCELMLSENSSRTANNKKSNKLQRRNSFPTLYNTRAILNTIKDALNNPEILLCGKGYPLVGAEITSLDDLKRTQYFKTYANEILTAIVLDGCNVVGFLPGTLLESWEWEHGFTVSYGLHQVKFEHPLKARIQRLSAKYLTKLFKTHGMYSITRWDYWDTVSVGSTN